MLFRFVPTLSGSGRVFFFLKKEAFIKQGRPSSGAGWSSPVARQAHNLKVAGSNPAPATNFFTYLQLTSRLEFEAAFLRFSAKPIRQLGAFVALP